MDNKKALLLMLHTLTPTHAGSGTQLSYVDLPIQRESHTGFPKIEASTLKGCIRSAVDSLKQDGVKKEDVERIFGKPNSGDFASAVSFTDARLLFFPVKSAIGIFAWITCPYVIRRFLKDYLIISEGKTVECDKKLFGFDFSVEEGTAVCASGEQCALKASGNKGDGKQKGNRIMLEDYTFDLDADQKKEEMFGMLLYLLDKYIPDRPEEDNEFHNKAIMVSDDDFSQFVKFSTEVSTRIKIDQETGTVAGTGLFTEEFLPPESILYSVVFCSASHLPQKDAANEERLDAGKVKDDLIKMFHPAIFQIGSDSTLGKGLVKKCFWEVK